MQIDRLCVAEGFVPVLLYFPLAQTGQQVVEASLIDWMACQVKTTRHDDTCWYHAYQILFECCDDFRKRYLLAIHACGRSGFGAVCLLLVRVAKG